MLNASGAAGNGGVNGAGNAGGGGGGDVWIDMQGVFDNAGLLAAEGGAGANSHDTGVNAGSDIGGAGAGGEIIIDPSEIINTGTINVSDGNGDNSNGGNVEFLSPVIVNSGQVIGQVPEPAAAVILFPVLAGLLRRRRNKK